MAPQVKEYGSWKSILDSKLACDSSVGIVRLYVDPATPGKSRIAALFPNRSKSTYPYLLAKLRDT